MARRVYYNSPPCAHEGCPERAHFEYTSRREQQDHGKSLQQRPWRCVRHSRPDAVLSPESPVRETVLVSHEETYGLFWRAEGREKGGSGFVYGDGFKAFAKDFPAGTRLTITARVEVPEDDGV